VIGQASWHSFTVLKNSLFVKKNNQGNSFCTRPPAAPNGYKLPRLRMRACIRVLPNQDIHTLHIQARSHTCDASTQRKLTPYTHDTYTKTARDTARSPPGSLVFYSHQAHT
jgi:hypothetical protein